MIRYFQITPDILLEYIYEGDPKLDEDKIKGNSKDIYDDSPTMLLKSEAFSSKYLFFKNDNEGLDSFSNLVLPLNNTQTQFVVAKSDHNNFFSRTNVSNRFLTKSGSGYLYVDTNYDANIQNAGKSCDVRYDKCIVHFTSRNFFGNYDSLIFQAYAYMNDKSKLYFSSFLFKKTSNLEMTPEHLLYNEKLYTTQIEFDIPSVYAILSTDESVRNDVFNGALSNKGVNFLKNTPIGIDLYGVSGSTKGTDNYVRLKTNKISSISIPYTYNRFDEINIDIYEALDGDYFYIDPKIGKGYSSFVDYIESMGEDIRAYMIMHELCLVESWSENDKHISEITHKEFHIIDINEDDEDDEIHRRFDAKIKYRPICMKSGDAYKATIIDTIKIINTVDSSSYEVNGSLEINPKKYGKKIMKLDFKNEVRPIVNVYNKNTSSNRNGISGIPGYGSVSGSKTIGSLNGSFIFSVSDGISGEYSGTLSGIGNFVGIISGVFSESGSLTGNISGTLSDLGGFISGTFSNQEFGKISGTISGYIPGLGYVTGTITGTYNTNDGFGEICGTITSSSSNSSISSANDSTSNSTSEGLVVVNKGGGFYVENMTQNITSFLESTNVGVCIVELSPDDIN